MKAPTPEPIELCLADLKDVSDMGYSELIGVCGRLSPSRAASVISKICHWALVVRGFVYEVTSWDYDKNVGNDAERKYRKPVALKRWAKLRRMHGIEYKCFVVGATQFSDYEIRQQASHIWDQRFKHKYKVHHSNCQDFVVVLRAAIKMDRAQRELFEEELETWDMELMPRPFSSLNTLLKSFAGLERAFVAKLATETVLDSLGLATSGFLPWAALVGTLVLIAPSIVGRNRRFKLKKFCARMALTNFRRLEAYLDPRLSAIFHATDDEYDGYHVGSVNRYVDSGFAVHEIVAGLRSLGLDDDDGKPFTLRTRERDGLLLAMIAHETDERNLIEHT